MPFQSKAQLRKFAELVKQGKMKQSTFNEWLAATGDTKLPERKGEAVEKPRSALKKRFGVK